MAGKWGQMKLDTASGITQVHQRWVPKEAMTGGNVRVPGVEGTTHTLPMATVQLQVNDCDQEMPVAVSNKLEYDALLGLDVALVRNMIPVGGEKIRQVRPRRICPRPETYAEPSEQGTESKDSGSEEAKFQADRKTLESSQQNHRWTLPQRMRKKQQTPQMYLEWYQRQKICFCTRMIWRSKREARNAKRERSTKPSGDRQFHWMEGQNRFVKSRYKTSLWNYQEESVANLVHPSSGRTISYIEDGNHPNRLRKWNN